MTTNRNSKSDAEFTGLTGKLLDYTFALREETYAATQSPPTATRLKKLIQRADAHVAEYNALVAQYTGGRKKSIEQAGPDIDSLVQLTSNLKALGHKA